MTAATCVRKIFIGVVAYMFRSKSIIIMMGSKVGCWLHLGLQEIGSPLRHTRWFPEHRKPESPPRQWHTSSNKSIPTLTKPYLLIMPYSISFWGPITAKPHTLRLWSAPKRKGDGKKKKLVFLSNSEKWVGWGGDWQVPALRRRLLRRGSHCLTGVLVILLSVLGAELSHHPPPPPDKIIFRRRESQTLYSLIL